MKKSFFVSTILFLSLISVLNGQTGKGYLREGNTAYKQGSYTQAEENYRKAEATQKTDKGAYNLGNAVYQQNRMEEAVKHYEEATKQTSDKALQANAYHNLGNALLQKGDLKGSIEAYKNALRLEPNDYDTKYNLSQALRRLQQQQQQQQNNSQDQQQQQNEEKEEQESQNQQQNQDQPQESEPQNEDNSEQNGEPRNLTREEADQLLKIMEQEEQKVQEKMKKAAVKPAKNLKDW